MSNLRRIRIRSNSTGGKHSSPKEPAGPRRFGNQLETPDRQRLPCGGKVPKSASVSALSLIITTGTEVYHQLLRVEQKTHCNLSGGNIKLGEDPEQGVTLVLVGRFLYGKKQPKLVYLLSGK